MKKRVLSLVISLALCLGLLPGMAGAATGEPTRTEQLDLSAMATTDKTSDEGWKWEPDPNGGTLTLTNCHIQSPNTKIIVLPNTGNRVYTIILNGNNILETTSTDYNPMIAAATPAVVGTFNVKSGQSGGSLELLASNAKTDGSNNPYGFAGQHFTFENINIKSNVSLAMFDQDFTMKNCGLTINGAETAYCGIYSLNGPIKIDNSNIDISVPQGAFFIDRDSTSDIKDRSIEISGGTARLSVGYCFFMTQINYSDEALANSVKLSNGAKVNCEKGGFYGADLTLEGEGTEMILAGRYYMYHSLSNKINIGEGTTLTLNGSETVTTGGSAPPTIKNDGNFIISRAGWIDNSENLTLSGNGGFYCTALSGSTTIEDSIYTGADQKGTLNISSSGSAIIKEKEFLPLSAKNVSNCTFERQDGDTWSAVTEIKDAGTYRASYNGNVIDTFSIAPRSITVKGITANPRAYDGTDQVDITAVALDGVLDADKSNVSVNTANLKGTISGSDVGTYKSVTLPALTLTGASAGNYTLTQPTGAVETSVTISKASYDGATTANTSAKFGVSASFDLTSLLPAGAVVGTVSITDEKGIFNGNPSVENGKLSYTLKADAAVDSTATVKIPVTESTNYNKFDLTVTVTVLDKYAPHLTVIPITHVYNGQPPAITGTASNEATGASNISGKWAFKDPAPVNVTDSGKKIIEFTPDDKDTYATATIEVQLTITAAPLSGKPTFTGGGSGKTLNDVTYTLPDGWDGTFAWKYDRDTAIEQGRAYEYTFTPKDGNYQTYTGSEILWARPSGGGGSGSSSVTTGTTTEGGTSTTQTTAVPSASNQNGAASAAVNTSMGDEIVRQAAANNSETVVIAPRVFGSVTKTQVSVPASTLGQLGSQTGASLTVSTPVGDVTVPNVGLGSLSGDSGTVTFTAEKTGGSVELSITVDGEEVQSIPGGVSVTVPAENTVPGTVAVLIREDGTREVVRKSVADKDSVTAPLEGSARLELVDNSMPFDDVPSGHWAEDAVAFTSAHELFKGTGPRLFSPDQPMSRGMLAVALHNLESNPTQAISGIFDDVSLGQWYTEGVTWAAANGVVKGYGDGCFGPGDSITREQLAVMLWRYSGSPAAGTDLPFADSGEASGWARAALSWAVEKGILNGRGNGILDPTGMATRAEAAQMLKNFMETW